MSDSHRRIRQLERFLFNGLTERQYYEAGLHHRSYRDDVRERCKVVGHIIIDHKNEEVRVVHTRNNNVLKSNRLKKWHLKRNESLR